MSTVVLRKSVSSADALTERMADALSVPDGGFSVSSLSGRDVRSGFAVAVFPELERQLTGRVSAADVRAYVFEHAATLVGNGLVVGGWRDPATGIAYLDVSRVVSTRAEAVALGRDAGQLAYFDFAAGRSVEISG